MFLAYGVGLAVGFFAYFLVLVLFVLRSPRWTLAWFLDGRRPIIDKANETDSYPGDRPQRPMIVRDDRDRG